MKKLPISKDNSYGNYWETNDGTKVCVKDLVLRSPDFKKAIIEELLEEHAAMQQIPEPSEKVMENQDAEIKRLKKEVEHWRQKFLKQRQHCRAANKGAERNSQVMRLLAYDCQKLQEKLKEYEQA